MPTIAAKWVKARALHSCAECRKVIQPGEKYVRAYGYAEAGDPAYVLRFHDGCVGTEMREKAGAP